MADHREIGRALSRCMEGAVSFDEMRLDLYSRAACVYRLVPVAVARPRHAADVRAAVEFACRNGLSIVPRGAGSSVAGGAVGNGVVLDLSDLAGIEILGDRVRVGPGVVRDDLEAALARAGRSFPVDPASGKWCSVGGMVMTNASGPHSLLYGSAGERLLEVEGVAADGAPLHVVRGSSPSAGSREERLASGVDGILRRGAADIEADRPRAPKGSCGYPLWQARGGDGAADLARLVGGSEGTLLVATSLTLSTIPRPVCRKTAVLFPRSLEEAVETVASLQGCGLSAMEILDDLVLDLLRGAGEGRDLLPPGPGGVLLWIDADAGSESEALAILSSALEKARPVEGHTCPEGEAAALETMRKRVSPLLKERAGAGRRPARFIEDPAVPPDRLPELVRGLRLLLVEAGLEPAPTFGHAGQGHLHCNPALDLSDPGDRARLEDLVRAQADLVRGLEGVPSGEHGDGRIRAGVLERVFPRSWRWMREVKALFDPEGTLNPGAKVPAPGGAPAPIGHGLDPLMQDLRMDGEAKRREFLRLLGGAEAA